MYFVAFLITLGLITDQSSIPLYLPLSSDLYRPA